ncbi:MAG: 2-hydroxychromene-2-carboxylate isomerase [Hyphomicrobiales bacterium]|nr:2-hydroxychromene-2-carboxylate isomerase [Hyphomicrobiales bacterium]MCP4997488.1 2-hydroxychromene-2-carboxylate isomerase [Hyphomicrobiales bacterium]
MSKTIDFYYDFVSSASYVAYKRLPEMVHNAGGTIRWKPMVLGGVFKAVGNAGPTSIAAKGNWMFDDLERICARHGIDFSVNPNFPLNTVMALRGAIAAEKIGGDVHGRYMDLMFKGAWADDDDLSNPEVVMELMDNGGLPAQEIANMVQDQAIKDELRANTEEAVERGAFGAPTFFVNGEMHWGQDRLDDVMSALDRDS